MRKTPVLKPRNPAFEAAEKIGAYPWMKQVDAHLSNGRVLVDGRSMIMLGGYSYFGLIKNDYVERRVIDAIRDFGVGSYGTRITSGTTRLHRHLEDILAEMTGTEAAVLYPSGFSANVSTINALVGKDDTIFVDRLAHASIFDGCTSSGASVTVLLHNNFRDLERKLKSSTPGGAKLVIIDAVYSMDGDIAALAEISEVCRRHGALLLVDECHSLFVLGRTGKGIEEHFGIQERSIDVKTGALSKAIPGTGGFAAGDAVLVRHLKEHGRTFLFSGAIAPPVVAGAIAAAELIRGHPEWIVEVNEKADWFRRKLRDCGVDVGRSESPIVPVMIPGLENAIRASSYCMSRGVYVQPICYPAVPMNMDRLRTTVTLEHSWADLEVCVQVLSEAFSMFGSSGAS